MFHTLNYSVTFPTTGRTLSNKLDFAQGFSAITGPNESGKSMIFEMLRFLLFGTQALRGEAADYTTLKVEGEVTIRDERYKIVRTMRRADIWRGTTLIATGTTPVNQKVGQLLGFGRAVFDVACAVNQGEIERLGSMTPAERKRLVDSVLGIDALDLVSKWAMEEAKSLDRDAATLRSSQVAPQGVVQPVDYEPSEGLRERVSALHADAMELSTLNGWLAAAGPGQPQKPACYVNLPATNLKELADKRATLRNEVANLQAKVQALPTSAPYEPAELQAMRDQHPAYDSYQKAVAYLRTHPKPRWLPQALAIYRDDWTALANQEEANRLDAQINKLVERGAKPCPHCAEDILCEHDEIERLRAKRNTLQLPDYHFDIKTPPVPMSAIDHEMAYALAFDLRSYEAEAAIAANVIEQPPSLQQIDSWARDIDRVVERAALNAKHFVKQAEFEAMMDYEAMYHQRLAYEQALSSYHAAEAAYMVYQQERGQKQVRAQALGGVDVKLQQAQAQLGASVAYEQALQRYEEAKAAYDAMVERADGLEASAIEHRKVRDTMNVLRTLIKAHILPSLNKVASHLLSGMTGGQRNVVCIDEEFNILIDNQDIQTLSGSGKSVANLALRIALGQVLTNRVISVLLADEIDASMDEFRAEQTALVLCTMANSVSQVLLVSHKSVVADNIVDLGVKRDSPVPDIRTAEQNP